MPRPSLAPFALCAVLAFALVPACSGASKAKAAPSAPASQSYLDKIDAYVERGRYTAALALIDEQIAQEPANYEHYLLRSTIFTAMRADDKALADLDAALAVYDKHKRTFPPKEQAPRLAGIRKEYALACYLAGSRAEGETQAKYRDCFEAQAAQVKSLDEATYARLMTLLGREPAGANETGPAPGPNASEVK